MVVGATLVLTPVALACPGDNWDADCIIGGHNNPAIADVCGWWDTNDEPYEAGADVQTIYFGVGTFQNAGQTFYVGVIVGC